MNDPLWQEAMAEIEHLPPAAKAYQLGQLYGWQHAKPTIGSREMARMEDAGQRVDALADCYGEWVYNLFSDAVVAVAGYNGMAGILRFDRAEREARRAEGGCDE